MRHPALPTSAGRKVDNIPVRREFESRVADGATHAIAALPHARIRQNQPS